jgi:hypothetical protein
MVGRNTITTTAVMSRFIVLFTTDTVRRILAVLNVVDVNRWDEKAGLQTGCCTLPSYRRAQGTDKKETGNEG